MTRAVTSSSMAPTATSSIPPRSRVRPAPIPARSTSWPTDLTSCATARRRRGRRRLSQVRWSHRSTPNRACRGCRVRRARRHRGPQRQHQLDAARVSQGVAPRGRSPTLLVRRQRDVPAVAAPHQPPADTARRTGPARHRGLADELRAAPRPPARHDGRGPAAAGRVQHLPAANAPQPVTIHRGPEHPSNLLVPLLDPPADLGPELPCGEQVAVECDAGEDRALTSRSAASNGVRRRVLASDDAGRNVRCGGEVASTARRPAARPARKQPRADTTVDDFSDPGPGDVGAPGDRLNATAADPIDTWEITAHRLRRRPVQPGARPTAPRTRNGTRARAPPSGTRGTRSAGTAPRSATTTAGRIPIAMTTTARYGEDWYRQPIRFDDRRFRFDYFPTGTGVGGVPAMEVYRPCAPGDCAGLPEDLETLRGAVPGGRHPPRLHRPDDPPPLQRPGLRRGRLPRDRRQRHPPRDRRAERPEQRQRRPGPGLAGLRRVRRDRQARPTSTASPSPATRRDRPRRSATRATRASTRSSRGTAATASPTSTRRSRSCTSAPTARSPPAEHRAHRLPRDARPRAADLPHPQGARPRRLPRHAARDEPHRLERQRRRAASPATGWPSSSSTTTAWRGWTGTCRASSSFDESGAVKTYAGRTQAEERAYRQAQAQDAFDRLTALYFDDSADMHNISMGLYDPVQAVDVGRPAVRRQRPVQHRGQWDHRPPVAGVALVLLGVGARLRREAATAHQARRSPPAPTAVPTETCD